MIYKANPITNYAPERGKDKSKRRNAIFGKD